MGKLSKRMFALLFILLLLGCSNEKYPPVKDKGNLAITVNIKDMTVSFISLDSKEKIAHWQMKKPYVGGMVLTDRDKLLLYGKGVDSADIFSLGTGKKIDSWSTGEGIVNGELLKNGQEIVFVDQSMNAIRFFSLDGKETKIIGTDAGPYTILEDDGGNILYVISFKSANLNVIDIGDKKSINQFPIHQSATGALLRDHVGEIWIGGHGEGTEIESDIHVYHVETGELLRKVSAPVMPINFSKMNHHVYVLSHGSNTLYKLDGLGDIIDSTKIGANPFEIGALGDNLIIAGYDSNDVHLINGVTLEVEGAIPVGKGPYKLIVRERITNE